jgi:hypothetical protein
MKAIGARLLPVPESGPAEEGENPRWGLAEWFIISQTAFPALLFVPGAQSIRLPLRIGPFAFSLALGMWTVMRRRRVWPHPSRTWLLATAAYLICMIFHPTTNTLVAGVGQAMLYVSVMAPAFWAPAFVKGAKHLERLLWILLICNGINSAVGVLQAYDPDTWLPSELSRIVLQSQYSDQPFWYQGPEGQSILRPPGLFDTPGAVAGPGAVASVLGLAFFFEARSVLVALACGSVALAGMAAILLSHVRTSGVIAGGMLLTYAAIRSLGGRRKKGLLFLGLALLFVPLSFSLAEAIGGDAVHDRFATLFQGSPLEVYYMSLRGPQLEDAFTNLIWEYPLGAGLGRWGMMHYYFGNPESLTAPPIWAELQPNAWILDGGIPLLLLYAGALLIATRQQLRLALVGSPLSSAAAAILAANVGTLALIFGFTPFTNQVGLQYWLLAGALHGAAQSEGVLGRDPLDAAAGMHARRAVGAGA